MRITFHFCSKLLQLQLLRIIYIYLINNDVEDVQEKKPYAAITLNVSSRRSESLERHRMKSVTTVPKPAQTTKGEKRRLQRESVQKERDGTRVPVSKVRDDRIQNFLL